ncbi:alpha/beta hydrolase [Sinomonas susongensis]|uniref:alpha/beta hydrolase n=1 Tax=Sinomonas susongensis TaxID=1324851 RepID=UPI0011084027|nr:alpha/beta hydrolase [Sinomonas susongensis]
METTQSKSQRSAVLVHGTWGNPGDWQWVRRILEANGFDVAVPDLPSHRLDAGLLEDAEEVKSAIRGYAGPVVVAGWSYGGDVIGLVAAGEQNVARLVYVSSVPQPIQEHPREATIWDGDPAVRWDDPDRFVLDNDWWVYEEKGTTFPEEVRRHIQSNPRRSASRRILTDPIPAAAWMEFPVSVLIGTRDELVSDDRRAWAKQNIKDVRDVDDDHFLIFNSPDLLADAIMEGNTQAQDA